MLEMEKLRRRLWLFLGMLTAIVFFYPINGLALRLGLIFLTSSGIISAMWAAKNKKSVFNGLLTVLLLLGCFSFLPGRDAAPEKLRDAYLRSLRSYEGTRYVWGGENKLGIDCSGLLRAGLIKANFIQGLKNLNPKLIRFAVSLWWHDCSAQALSKQFRNLTKHILSTKSINALNESKIAPGDIAVTANGIHVLAFLGNHEWIEADPNIGRVVIARVPTAKNPWFDEPADVMRWTQLETK